MKPIKKPHDPSRRRFVISGEYASGWFCKHCDHAAGDGFFVFSFLCSKCGEGEGLKRSVYRYVPVKITKTFLGLRYKVKRYQIEFKDSKPNLKVIKNNQTN